MNVYDFDGTIYNGDSTIDFYIYSLVRLKNVKKYIPLLAIAFFKYVLRIYTNTQLKEKLFIFLKDLSSDEIDNVVADFWMTHEKKIYNWYLKEKRTDDLIISASPDFYLKYIADKYNVNLIATKLDVKSCKIVGNNCKAEEKVIKYKEVFKDTIIENFYSDSMSDKAMMLISENAYLVKNGRVIKKV